MFNNTSKGQKLVKLQQGVATRVVKIVDPLLKPNCACNFHSVELCDCVTNSKMTGQVVLITGCSTGLGLDFAVTLAKDPDQRYIVYATMRNLTKKDELVKQAGNTLGKTLFIKQLHVTWDEEIKEVVANIYSEQGHIDILGEQFYRCLCHI